MIKPACYLGNLLHRLPHVKKLQPQHVHAGVGVLMMLSATWIITLASSGFWYTVCHFTGFFLHALGAAPLVGLFAKRFNIQL